MWKWLNNAKGARQPVVADQGYYGGTFNEGGYENSGYNRTQSPLKRNQPPPKPRREDMESELLSLPFEATAPQQPPPRNSSFRPVSSIYSEPSPDKPTSRFSRDSYTIQKHTYTEEVSSPSSPDFAAVKHPNAEDDDVSPIDKMPDMSKLGFGRQRSNRLSSSHVTSSIPVLRREKKHNQIAAAASNFVSRKKVKNGRKGRKTVDLRWDFYSGEITTSKKSKPQSVKPGEFTPPGLRSTRIAPMRNESNINGPPKQHSSFEEQVQKLKNHTAPSKRPE